MSVTEHCMGTGSMKQKQLFASGTAKISSGMKEILKTETNANHIEIQFVPYRQHSWLRTSKTIRHSPCREITRARASAFLVDRYAPAQHSAQASASVASYAACRGG